MVVPYSSRMLPCTARVTDSATTAWAVRAATLVGGLVQRDAYTFKPQEKLSVARRRIVQNPALICHVVDEDGRLLGVFTKTDIINPPRAKLVLVDHNELGQAVSGADEADIVEVLDPEAKPDERCDKCPSDRKGQPLKGLRIIGNVDPVPKGTVWGSGVILDPDDGREYRLEMDWRIGAQELKLRGYWGPFWRTQVWRRPAGAG